jgi:hypothetical protein
VVVVFAEDMEDDEEDGMGVGVCASSIAGETDEGLTDCTSASCELARRGARFKRAASRAKEPLSEGTRSATPSEFEREGGDMRRCVIDDDGARATDECLPSLPLALPSAATAGTAFRWRYFTTHAIRASVTTMHKRAPAAPPPM